MEDEVESDEGEFNWNYNVLEGGGKTTGLEEVDVEAVVDGLIKIVQAEDDEIFIGRSEQDPYLKSTDRSSVQMDVHQMDISALEDGKYHPNILRLIFKHLIMAKDQRRVGKSSIKTFESHYPAHLIQVCVKYNKPIERLVHWDGLNEKSCVETILWHSIEKAEGLDKGRREKVCTNRFSPNLSNEEQARRKMAGNNKLYN